MYHDKCSSANPWIPVHIHYTFDSYISGHACCEMIELWCTVYVSILSLCNTIHVFVYVSILQHTFDIDENNSLVVG